MHLLSGTARMTPMLGARVCFACAGPLDTTVASSRPWRSERGVRRPGFERSRHPREALLLCSQFVPSRTVSKPSAPESFAAVCITRRTISSQMPSTDRSTSVADANRERDGAYSSAITDVVSVGQANGVPQGDVRLAREGTTPVPDYAYSVAPMMEVTDRHFRTLARLISRRATLYTEMVVDRTLIHNPQLRELELRIPPIPPVSTAVASQSPASSEAPLLLTQHPLVLQLGGSVPEELEQAAKIAADYGYTEVNLNCGCPSPKVAGKGCFGAALMRTPEVVAEATRRMKAVLPGHIPVTVKCRIGVDDDDSYESLQRFVSVVSERGGVHHFIIHARKAILQGLSPAENRTIPPLKPHYVYKLRQDFPQLLFSINGGIKTMSDVTRELGRDVHGAMVGRAVMNTPWHALCDVDALVYGEKNVTCNGDALTRRNVLKHYIRYAEAEVATNGAPVRVLIRPLLNLFSGEPNGKKFRRMIDEALRDKSRSVRDVIESALKVIPNDVLDRPPPSSAIAQDNVSVGDTPSPKRQKSTGDSPDRAMHDTDAADVHVGNMEVRG